MPIAPESPAADRVRREAASWLELADIASQIADGPRATEASIMKTYDPGPDLEKRASFWGHRLDDHTVVAISLFAGGLAAAEADAWADDVPDVAARAATERRFLVADRLIHWAVPWLYTRPDDSIVHRVLSRLNALSDPLRIAPLVSGNEGITAPGEDRYGPLPPPLSPVGSLLIGDVIPYEVVSKERSGSAIDELSDEETVLIRHHLDGAATRWNSLIRTWPGSAALWTDLERRARDSVSVCH